MHQALDISHKNLAVSQDLEKIGFSTLQLAGTGSLSPLARRWLSFCVVIARLGYEGIHAPMWAVVKSQYQAQGQTKSESTAYRGLKALEVAGYIRRQKYRVSDDRFAVKIYFQLDKFKYWLREKTHIQSVTCDYIAAQLSKCEEVEVTNQGSRVNSQDSSVINKEPARATIYNKEQGKNPMRAKERETAIFYTLKLVTRGMGKSRRRLILARAFLELGAPKLRASGVDWEKWAPSWLELGIEERESIALEQIIPYLENMAPVEKASEQIKRIIKQASGAALSALPACEGKPVSRKDVEAMIRAAGLCGELRINSEAPQPTPAPKSTLPDDELEILRGAKERAIGRAGCR